MSMNISLVQTILIKVMVVLLFSTTVLIGSVAGLVGLLVRGQLPHEEGFMLTSLRTHFSGLAY